MGWKSCVLLLYCCCVLWKVMSNKTKEKFAKWTTHRKVETFIQTKCLNELSFDINQISITWFYEVVTRVHNAVILKDMIISVKFNNLEFTKLSIIGLRFTWAVYIFHWGFSQNGSMYWVLLQQAFFQTSIEEKLSCTWSKKHTL